MALQHFIVFLKTQKRGPALTFQKILVSHNEVRRQTILDHLLFAAFLVVEDGYQSRNTNLAEWASDYCDHDGTSSFDQKGICSRKERFSCGAHSETMASEYKTGCQAPQKANTSASKS